MPRSLSTEIFKAVVSTLPPPPSLGYATKARVSWAVPNTPSWLASLLSGVHDKRPAKIHVTLTYDGLGSPHDKQSGVDCGSMPIHPMNPHFDLLGNSRLNVGILCP